MPRVRVFVDHAGQLRRACDVTVTNTDASIYITPSSRERRYNFGRASIPTGAQSATFSVLGQLEASEDPHVSLHQSGQVHIRTKGGPKAGPLRIPPLQQLRGGHVATVTCGRHELLLALPGMSERTKSHARRRPCASAEALRC